MCRSPIKQISLKKNVLPIQCYARGNNDEHGILFLLNWGNANRFYKPLKYEQGARFYKPRWKGEIHKQNAKQIPSISMYFKGQCFTDRSIRSSSFKQGLYNSKDHFSSITSPLTCVEIFIYESRSYSVWFFHFTWLLFDFWVYSPSIYVCSKCT